MLFRVSLKNDALIVVDAPSSDEFKDDAFTWLRVVEPTAEEAALIGSFLKLDENDQEDLDFFLKEGGRSRVERSEMLTIVYSVPVIVDKEVTTEEILIYATRDLVITVERKRLRVCERLLDAVRKQKVRYLFKRHAGTFITELIDEINDRFLKHVNRIENRLDLLSGRKTLLSSEQIEAISSASATLVAFNQASLANLEVLNTLKKTHHPCIAAKDREAFNDVYFDALQIMDAQKVQREMIMNIFSVQSIISSNQMNAFIKKLTAFTLVIMVPTLISGIYGMNLAWLPFAEYHSGFFIILAIMAVITGLLVVIFKQLDWF